MVIPRPNNEFEMLSSTEFVLIDEITILSPPKLEKQALIMQSKLERFYDLNTTINYNERNVTAKALRVIEIELRDEIENAEEYQLRITGDHIKISGKTPKGVFYGIQTILQMIHENSLQSKVISLSPQQLRDRPRFSWRGFMLDEARHFHGKEVVMEIIDLISMLKINKFHWHLTDDQGWRIEIDEYPKLISIGSRRNKTQVGGLISYITRKTDNTVHEGFYTKKEIREIITYAEHRAVEIIPEIDLPGHSSALIAAYPSMSCDEIKIEVPGTFGIKKTILCAGKDEVFNMLEDILSEIVELFPSKYIHIGGDEAPKKKWMNCTDCQQRIKDESLEDEEELQGYFMNRVESILKSHHKTVIMWNDGMTKNVSSSIMGQYWLFNHDQVINELKNGRAFIFSHFFSNYLDYNYYLTPLQKTYEYNPMPDELKNHMNGVLGIEAPLWTEWVKSRDRLYWQILPRLIAMAENAWTNNRRKDYNDFEQRLNLFVELLHYIDIPFADLNNVNPSRLQRTLHVFSILTNPKLRFG